MGKIWIVRWNDISDGHINSVRCSGIAIVLWYWCRLISAITNDVFFVLSHKFLYVYIILSVIVLDIHIEMIVGGHTVYLSGYKLSFLMFCRRLCQSITHPNFKGRNKIHSNRQNYMICCPDTFITHWSRVTHISVSKMIIICLIMACCLFDAKQLSASMLEYCK